MKLFERSLLGRWPAIFPVLLASLFLSGCAATGKVPLESLNYQRDDVSRQPNLLVLLRGLGADHREFERQGVIEEIRHLGLPFDVTAPNAHFGYYQARTFAQRLKEDVIEPARRQGYKQVWLAGFSMGGLGALIYLREHPEDIDGILLTSPFLGGSEIHREIDLAGGVSEWLPEASDPDDWEQMIWGWISQQDFKTQVPIWLGYGENDILTRAGPPLLGSVLPKSRVFSVPGNHTIPTFKTLFSRHLLTLAKESQPLPVVLSARDKLPSTF